MDESSSNVYSAPHSAPASSAQPKVQTLEDMERQAIAAALVRHGGNKRKAAEELGISERTIHRKIADYGLQ